MVGSERGAQTKRASKLGQAEIRVAAILVAAGWLLAGCSSLSSINPANWWHRQEGGKIAEQRPAPPGADQPYPDIATVPAKPAPPDAEALKNLTASLVADRTNAQHAAQSSPLADPSSPTASPALFGVGTAPPPPPPSANGPAGSGSPGTPVASASMPAVTAPPAPQSAPPQSAPAPPSAAPRRSVQSTPLEAAPATSVPEGTPPPSAAPAPATPQPALPNGPPTRPTGAPEPPVAVVAPAPMPSPPTGTSATIVFVEGAANLSAPAADEVKAFAAKRGNGTIAITGYGDAASNEPDAQSAAVNLGLSRAQSIVEALKAAGVPGAAIRVSAEASGRGASLHLLQ